MRRRFRRGCASPRCTGWLLCPVTARVLLLDNAGVFNLPGGTPEARDHGVLDATLAREAVEEVQAVIRDPVYLGYQQVREPGTAPYAQVRMTALIGSLGPRRPDPDGGRMYRRLLAPVGDAPAILGWGDPAVAQAAAVARVAGRRWDLRVDAPSEPAGYAD
ncbi:MAG: NUDIX hydrolase [Streptosporangiaceae bacterium]